MTSRTRSMRRGDFVCSAGEGGSSATRADNNGMPAKSFSRSSYLRLVPNVRGFFFLQYRAFSLPAAGAVDPGCRPVVGVADPSVWTRLFRRIVTRAVRLRRLGTCAKLLRCCGACAMFLRASGLLDKRTDTKGFWDMNRLLSAADPERNPIIQILSAFNCRFFGPTTR